MKYVFWLVFILVSWPASAEDRTRIAIIDTGISRSPAVLPYLCAEGSQDFTGQGLDDLLGHGTAVAMLAVDGLDPSKYCLLILKWCHISGGPRAEERVVEAIQAAIREKAKYINMSLTGVGANPDEQIALQEALDKGTTVVVAAGNDSKDLRKTCDVYPPCYPLYNSRFHVVANSSKGHLTNYGGPVTDWAPGFASVGPIQAYGTSFSAPRILNRLVKEHR